MHYFKYNYLNNFNNLQRPCKRPPKTSPYKYILFGFNHLMQLTQNMQHIFFRRIYIRISNSPILDSDPE